MTKTSLGLGLAAIGRPDYINIRSQQPDKSRPVFKQNSFKVLDEAYRLGIRHFDVAASYGYGEQFLLEWLSKRKHNDVSCSTKWGYTYMANWKIGYSGKHEIKEHSLEKLNEQWSYSKQFLPWLTIYQIHSATIESGVLDNAPVLERLQAIKNKYKIKIGISTSGPGQKDVIEKAETIVLEDAPLFDAYQVTYNLLEQSVFESLQNLISKGKIVIIKEALANGRLFRNNDYPNYTEVYKVLDTVSREFNMSVDAIALKFIIDTLEPNLILSGAANPVELQSNTTCMNIELSPSVLERLKGLQIDSEYYWSERSCLPWQ
jgi:aryl-alcohol dehydrogenase-like predicted oxidoreductase